MKKYLLLLITLFFVFFSFAKAPNVAPANATFVSQTTFVISVAVLFLLLIAAVVYLLQRFKRVETKLSALKVNKPATKAIPDDVFINAVNKPQSQKSEVAKLIDNNKTIAEFQKAIETLQIKVSKLEEQKNKPVVQPATVAAPQPAKQEPALNEVFYMTLPINNYFLVKSKSSAKENTVYKFAVKPNKQEAIFTVHVSGPQLSDILSATETYIRPACNEENMPDTNVKSIATLEPGLALLDGDKWIIKNKALIRYE